MMENLIDLGIEDEDDLVAQHIKSLEQADFQRNQLIKKLCHEIRDLKSALAQKTLEHNGEIDRRRNLESQAQDAASALKLSQQSMKNHNHALVLLDGNSCVFKENLLQKGAIGGAEAAYQLHDEIRTHIQSYDGAKQWKVLVRVYVDLDSLCRTLRDTGFKCNRGLLHQFFRGFTQHQPLFDIVDVGHGREQVEVKMEEFFKLFMESVQCQHILLGYCHHPHLAALLQPYKESILDLHRITLLKTTDFDLDYALKSYNVVEFARVFKSTTDSGADLFKPDVTIKYSTSSILTDESLQSTIQDRPATRDSSNSSISDKPSTSQRPRTVRGAAAIPHPKRSPTWDPTRSIVLLNINDERIDADLGKTDPDAERRVKKRAEHTRLCNDFHLRGACYTPSCAYSHEPRLTAEELIALRYRARHLPCVKGSACRTPDCWYGHMCFQDTCRLPNTCRFRAFHDMDRTAVTVWQKSGAHVRLSHESTDQWTADSHSDDSLR